MQNLTAKTYIFFITISLSLLLLLSASAPPIDYVLLKRIPVKASFLTTDMLSNAYLINEQNHLLRYDSTGNINGRFSDNRFGKLSSVDATSPFNLLLFYKDHNALMTIDHQMNLKKLFKLSNVGIKRVSAACLSHDNYIWVFDQNESKLKKVNGEYEVIHESLEINQLLGEEINPTFMLERDNFVFMTDPEMGILVFDLYGNYYNSFPVFGLTSFQLLNKNIIYLMDGELNLLHYGLNDVKRVAIPAEGEIESVSLQKDRMFILKPDELLMYGTL